MTATFLYAISSSKQPAPVKIGKSTDVASRLRQLQTASPAPLRVWWQHETEDLELEKKLHRHFSSLRMSGEWFGFQEADWLTQLIQAADLLEGRSSETLESTGSNVMSHTHQPHDGSPDWTLEGAGEGDRCRCGHMASQHVGPAPYPCSGLDPRWNCHYECECVQFRSELPWSMSAWMKAAAWCPRCLASDRN